jgi:hypothetical protein
MLNRNTHDTLSLQVVVLAVAAGLIGGLLAGRLSTDHPVLASEPPAKVMTAQAFKLVDGHGATRAALSTSIGGEPALEFYDSAHRMRVVLDMTGGGDPRLFLMDADGRIRTVMGLGLGDDGRPFVRLRDQNGNLIWSVPQPKSNG